MQIFSEVIAGSQNEDRLKFLKTSDGHFFVVADGAGGTSGGAQAAELACEQAAFHSNQSVRDWNLFLEKLDQTLMRDRQAGETTCVVLEVNGSTVSGASVGDSSAWIISESGIIDLTETQTRKPLLGSGEAKVKSFGPVAVNGKILIASDGLFKYANRQKIYKTVMENETEVISKLIDLVRLPNGKFQDDVAMILIQP